ncbi:MAG: M13 family metallopeptidase [Patescibacteria group bacterium]
MTKKSKSWWGFDTAAIDKSVRPQDDFYRYANGTWLKTNKIPGDESRWGSFVTLRYETEQQLKTLVENTKDKKVGAMFRSALDLKTRNQLGAKPMWPLRAGVHAIKDKKEFLKALADLHVLGISGLWGAMVDQDSKDSTKYRLHLWQGGLGLPEREYYLSDKPEQKRVRDAYIVHIKKLSKLAQANISPDVVMRIETALAKASMPKEDTRDAEKTYHKMSTAQLQKKAPTVDWSEYFARTRAKGVKELIVGQPEFFAAVSKLIKDTPLQDLKTYMEWHVINNCASLLSEPFVKENFHFYGTTLTGVKKMRAPWRRALGATNGALGELVGKLYIERYFPASAKKAMDELVSDLFDVYEERIKALDWMSLATKRKAVIKLRMMSRKIGYPRKWKKYPFDIMAKDYFGNCLRSEVYEHKRAMAKLQKKVDRGEWHMSPQTVNAYCNFNLNEIVFPAAILQWPFFDPRADAAINYAGIGTVIGHEMTHGFDDQGAKFDGKGNMKGWWTAADNKRFAQKGGLLKTQYDGYVVTDGVKVNGQLTLGENIADLGGLAIGWDAYQKYLAKHGRKTIDGFSSEQRFFLGFAQMERELTRPEFVKMQALTDPHSPAPFRINGPLANFEPFYKLLKLSKKDKLFRPPSKRAKIW